MHTAILLAASALGIDYGWQPLDGGGFEYIIQIEPELLDSLRAGETLRSDLPSFMRDVRSYRILCGRAPVPRLGNPEAAAPVERLSPEPAPATRREEPAESGPGGNLWSPTKPEQAEPPMRAPRNEPRYPDYRTETSPPKSRTSEPPGPANEDPPRPFLPDADSRALVQKTSAYHGAGEGSHDKGHDHEEGPSAKTAKAEEAAKPWLPLTATLLGLFVSLGGNAYLGLQWWATRHRCLELLRTRRGPAARTPLKKPQRESEVQQEYDEAPSREEEPEDDEDQDVRAISEEELTPQKRRR